MQNVGVGRLSASSRVVEARRAVRQAGPGARVGVRRRVPLRPQCHGRSGKLDGLALDPPLLRRILGTFGIVALFAYFFIAAPFPKSNRGPAPADVDTLVRENAELKAEQDALRERALDLAEQLCGRIEQGRRMMWMAQTPGPARAARRPPAPAVGADSEALAAWLDEQGARLEALGDQLTAPQLERGLQRASVPATAGRGTVAPRDSAPRLVADTRLAGRPGAAPARHR